MMDEEQEPPKKIALKVPSLFIKSTPASSQSEENGEKKKIARPMPASMKKKLEESKKTEADSQSSVSDTSESVTTSNNGENKPRRAMPASMKKKLEESKKTEADSQSSVSDTSESITTTTSNNGENKPKRPMPASARRKLEESVDSPDSTSKQEEDKDKRLNKPMPSSAKKKLIEGEQNTTLEKSEETDSTGTNKELNEDKSESGVKVKAMPASARKRMEEAIGEAKSPDTANSQTPGTKISSRPMPASARKMLEAQTDENANGSMEEILTEKTASTKEHDDSEPNRGVKKPMPASARRKLQEGSNQSNSELDSSMSGEESNNINDETVLVESQPYADNRSEMKEQEQVTNDMDDSTKESKKINISLGGIKFPTFKKPMPASAKKKAEVKEQELDKTSEESKMESESAMNIPTSKVESQDDTVGQSSTRSTRRGRSTNEFMELDAERFPCSVCGQEYYRESDRIRHEKTHLPKGEDNGEGKGVVGNGNKKSSKSDSSYKKKKYSKESKYKGMKSCPHCDRPFSDWKKLAKHASWCRKPEIPCLKCGKKFKYTRELEAHKKTHKSVNENQDIAEAIPVPLSSLDFGEDSVPSPMSIDSKNSSKNSVVEKPKPMPKSVKAKLEKDNNVVPESEIPKELSTGAQSFKRKIADVLSNLGSRRYANAQSPEVNDEIAREIEDDGPPRKKTIMSREGEGESIRGHPMPASVKKKLQDRGSRDLDKVDSEPAKKKSATSKSKSEKLVDEDLDDSECIICHKVFSGVHSRRKHERNVHKIKNPRGTTVKSTAPSPQPSPKPEKIVEEDEDEIQEPKAIKLDFSKIAAKDIPCPICSKLMSTRTNLIRHIKTVHKISKVDTSSSSTPVKQPVVARPSAPKSYKIYKTATNKLKQKLAPSTSTKKPVVSLEKTMPMSKVIDDIKTEVKVENKVIGSTASSDLRCACCDKIFEVKCDFYDHMSMEHPKLKRLITCKLCDHRFSHEEDFFLHMQFKHPNLVGEASKRSPKMASGVPSSKKEEPVKQRSSSRKTLDTSLSKQHGKSSVTASGNVALTKTISIDISLREKQRAEALLKKSATKKSHVEIPTTKSTRTTRRSLPVKTPTPEPEQMEESFFDNEPDDHFDDSAMQVDEEEEESEIAITATYSQKSASQKSSNVTGSFELDPMHCSTCSDVFYSYEALRKHELYFHNVKTTKMCPICGVYPSKLSRHLLAHENKTVRCSCVPCNLIFPEFSQLLKHNLEKHPGANGGTLLASNKPKADISKSQQNDNSDAYRCLLCKKEFSGSTSARRHIRRSHPEQGDNAENLVEKVTSDKPDKEVEEILQDTNKKLLDPDWDDNDDDVVEMPKTPPPPPPQPSSTVKKTSKPMPASARAKLQQEQENPSKTVKNNNEPKPQTAKPGGRPMPASVRAKLDAQTKNSEESNPKPARPMPASVRAKLLSQNSASENSRESSVVSSSSTKPRRPMPASVKAKLGITSVTSTDSGKSKDTAVVVESDDEGPPVLTPEVILETKANKIGQGADRSPEILVTLDDDDDRMDDDYLPEPEEPSEEPIPPSVPTFSIADEIAEHNRAVRMAMGDSNRTADSEFSFNMFQCKLCNKKFDTAETTRRHIHRFHSEYGLDHAENLIAQLFDNYANTPRRRKSNVRYNEDYVEDDDEEVIIPRGTSRRPKQVDTEWASSYSPSEYPTSSDDNPLPYACRFCGQRKNSIANIRRHISKAHPHLMDQRDSGVVVVGSNDELPPPPPPPSSTKATAKPTNTKAGGPIYVCRICSRCMAVRQSLYQHILSSHPDVDEGNVANYIQELNGSGGGGGSSVSNNSVAVEAKNSAPDNSFYCSMCQYQTSDEADYVRHHKSHTGGVSPYQCQYCSATFNRQHQLNAHVTREHTGAEFLTNDEAEISMEEVVGANQISVATTSKIHIDSPKPLSLNRRYSSESNGQSNVAAIKKYTPGPASRKTAASRKSAPPPVKKVDDIIPMETENSPPPSPPPASPILEHEETGSPLQEQNEASTFSYQGDLSSLFPSLGGGSAPGGIDALDDIDGGMCLD